MKTIGTLILLLTLVLVGCNSPSEENPTRVMEEPPHDYLFMQRAYPFGEIRTDAYAEAIQWKRDQANRNAAGNAIWEFTGPLNIGGRISDVEIPSGSAQTYYVGAASGGIFKTTDGGANWNPIFDDQQMLSIGDMEISRNNNDLVWVGTGEPNAGGGSLAYDGDGVYKSTDGGTTWESKGLPEVGSIGKIVIDPNDDNTVFVGAMGPLFRNDNNRGVYKTTDGGDTWNQVLFVSDSTGVIDMAIHPTNSNVVYAASWERIRRPDRRQYGGETSGLYRSNDGGATWIEMTNGLPTNPNDKGRISIDISRSNPNVLYARYANASGSIQGVYRTADGGNTWVTVNSSQLTNVGFHWWFRGIFVDPSDEDIIYNVDFVVEKSTDGGNNWFTAFPGVHVDQHALAFNDQVASEVILGNDGGLYVSSDDGASSVKDLTLPITQFYRFHVDAQNVNKVYGGSQDNSTMRTTTGGLSDWTIINGGDGFQPLVDPNNTNVIYALSQFGAFVKSTNDGASFNSALNGVNPAEFKNWDTPTLIDPNDSQTLYIGTNRVYKTTDAANNWSAISPDLTNGPPTGNLIFGTVTTIDVSPLDSDIIYAGTDDGNVWATNDGGSNWTQVSAALPVRWVTKVLASRSDANTVYVTLSGYRYGEDNGHVYKSTDQGANWTDIGTSLPDIPVNDIVQDSFGNLFLGTDIGVMASNDEGANWQILGENMPSVVVTDMHIHEGSDFLFAGTYGRSSYKLDISTDVLSIPDNALINTIVMAPNPANGFTELSLPSGLRNVNVVVYDALGRSVSQTVMDAGTQRLDLAGLTGGIYYVRISDGKNSVTRKLIIGGR